LIRATRELISTYARHVRSEMEQDCAMACWAVEEQMAWGITLFRGISDLEKQIRSRTFLGGTGSFDSVWEEFDQCYRVWAGASERLLGQAEELFKQGFNLFGLSEFRAAVEWRESIPEGESAPATPPIDEESPLGEPPIGQRSGEGERKSTRVKNDDKAPLPPRRRGQTPGVRPSQRTARNGSER
jgi:hypothetical protein